MWYGEIMDELKYKRRIRKIFDHIIQLIYIDEQIAEGKKRGLNDRGEHIDLKKERTKLKHQIQGYMRWMW